MRDEFYLKIAADCLRITLESSDGGCVLGRPLKARNCALCGAHEIGNCVLGKASAGTCLEHLVGQLILQLQCFIGFGEALALGRAGHERLVVMYDGLEFQVSHVAAP